jgi:hypothetical protein
MNLVSTSLCINGEYRVVSGKTMVTRLVEPLGCEMTVTHIGKKPGSPTDAGWVLNSNFA